MGRKPSAAKSAEKAHMPENTYPLEWMEPQPGNGNIKLSEGVDYQLENPLKCPDSSVDGAETRHERSSAQEQVNPKYELQKKTATLRRKKAKYHATGVRRSERIKSAVAHPSNHGSEYIEDITLSESDKDEPGTQMEEVLAEPEPEPEPEPVPDPKPEENLSEKSLGEKVDYALQRIESLEKSIELLKSRVDENIDLYETPSWASITYRTMYIDSQKKLEALTDENRRLTGKMENALGKIEVYEKENRVFVEILDKMKEAVNAAVISSLTKTTEAAVNASTQAIRNACSASAAKRKRNET